MKIKLWDEVFWKGDGIIYQGLVRKIENGIVTVLMPGSQRRTAPVEVLSKTKPKLRLKRKFNVYQEW